MSGFSRVLMDLGNTINRYSVVFIAVLAVIVIGFFAYNHTATSRENRIFARC